MLTDPDDCNQLTHDIIGGVIEVHRRFGPGLLESTYSTCLRIELEARGHTVSVRVPVALEYRGVRIDAAYWIDMLVDDRVILELKAVEALAPVHTAQMLTLPTSHWPRGWPVDQLQRRAVAKDGIKRIVQSRWLRWSHAGSAGVRRVRERPDHESLSVAVGFVIRPLPHPPTAPVGAVRPTPSLVFRFGPVPSCTDLYVTGRVVGLLINFNVPVHERQHQAHCESRWLRWSHAGSAGVRRVRERPDHESLSVAVGIRDPTAPSPSDRARGRGATSS